MTSKVGWRREQAARSSLKKPASGGVKPLIGIRLIARRTLVPFTLFPAGLLASASGPSEFERALKPFLQENCIHCHGEEKQKADYTLTDKEIAFKGGDSEIEAIVPGNPAKSLLVESILLPTDDDYVMPPDGKEPLTSFEILAIVEWVRDGAVWPVGDK